MKYETIYLEILLGKYNPQAGDYTRCWPAYLLQISPVFVLIQNLPRPWSNLPYIDHYCLYNVISNGHFSDMRMDPPDAFGSLSLCPSNPFFTLPPGLHFLGSPVPH